MTQREADCPECTHSTFILDEFTGTELLLTLDTLECPVCAGHCARRWRDRANDLDQAFNGLTI